MLNNNLGKLYRKSVAFNPSVGGGNQVRIFGTGERALDEPTILTCLKIITNAVGSLPVTCTIGKKTYNAFDPAVPPEAAVLIRRPNKDETTQQMMSKVAANLVMYNEAYLQFKTMGGRLRSIECISTEKITRSQNTKGEWVYNGTDNQNNVVISNEIVRLVGLQLDQQAINILRNSANLIDLSLNSISGATTFYKQGPKNAGFIVAKNKLNEEKYARIKSQIDASGNEEEAGKYTVLDNDMQFISNSFNMKDTGFNETRDQSVETIAMLMGVPLQLIGGTGDSSYKDLKEVRSAFLGLTINPILVAIENAIHDKLNYRVQIDFQEREYLNSDYEARAKQGMEMFKLGLASNLEARALADMDNEGIEEKFVAESNNLTFDNANPTNEV